MCSRRDELRFDLASGAIDVNAASRTEGRIGRYIRTRVMQLNVPAGVTMRIGEISAHAPRLVGEAIGLLRAR
jgi:hypothetical protein